MKGKPPAPALDGGAGAGDRPGESTAVKLTPDEALIASRLGIKPEDYAKYKDVKTLQS
jgi:phage I-like protein